MFNLLDYGKKLELHTGINAKQCIAIIEGNALMESGPAMFMPNTNSRELVYRIKGNEIRLWRWRHFIHNGFKPYYYASINEEKHGTIVKGRFRLHPFTRIFIIVLFSFGCALAVLTFGLSWLNGNTTNDLFGPIICLVWLVLLISFLRFGLWFGDCDIEYITNFLKQYLQAVSVEEQK